MTRPTAVQSALSKKAMEDATHHQFAHGLSMALLLMQQYDTAYGIDAPTDGAGAAGYLKMQMATQKPEVNTSQSRIKDIAAGKERPSPRLAAAMVIALHAWNERYPKAHINTASMEEAAVAIGQQADIVR